MHLINALHTSDLNCSKGYFKTNTPPIQILLINALHLTALLQMLLINAAPTPHLRHMHQINIPPIQILLINAFHRPVTSNAYNKHPSPQILLITLLPSKLFRQMILINTPASYTLAIYQMLLIKTLQLRIYAKSFK